MENNSGKKTNLKSKTWWEKYSKKLKNIFNAKNTIIFGCVVPILLLSDMFVYVFTKINIPLSDSKHIFLWVLQFVVYVFLLMVAIYLLICLFVNFKWIKLLLFVPIVVNIYFIFSSYHLFFISPDILRIIIWTATDMMIAVFVVYEFDQTQIFRGFQTIETIERYSVGGKKIEKATKTYPVILPIVTAIITASGMIIAAIISNK